MIVGDPAGAFGEFGIPVIPDQRPDEGPLAGIRTALLHTDASLVFCCACDMPFLATALVVRLLELAEQDVSAVLPRVHGEPEPLCAVYPKETGSDARARALGAAMRECSKSRARSRIAQEGFGGKDPGPLDGTTIESLEIGHVDREEEAGTGGDCGRDQKFVFLRGATHPHDGVLRLPLGARKDYSDRPRPRHQG